MRGMAPENEVISPLGGTGPDVAVLKAPHLGPLEVPHHDLLVH